MPWLVRERHYKALLGATTAAGVVIFSLGSMIIMDFQTWAGVPLLVIGIAIAMLPTTNFIHVRPEDGSAPLPARMLELGTDGAMRTKGSPPKEAGIPMKAARKVRRA